MLRIDFNLVLTIINLIVLYLILRKFLFRQLVGNSSTAKTYAAYSVVCTSRARVRGCMIPSPPI